MPRTAVVLSSLACWAGLSFAAPADTTAAQRAADAVADNRYGDDIQSDFRARRVQVADLDGDGRAEILFLLTATCAQANFDCENSLTVLDALRPNDPRAQPSRLSDDAEKAHLARVRALGYVENASAQIPGEVESIRVADQRISVAFLAREASPFCQGDAGAGHGHSAACPAPGRHTWHYAWKPGALTRLAPAPGRR